METNYEVNACAERCQSELERHGWTIVEIQESPQLCKIAAKRESESWQCCGSTLQVCWNAAEGMLRRRGVRTEEVLPKESPN
jgi:hypothetical protein